MAKRVEELCTQQGFSEELLSSHAAKPRARVENARTITRTMSGKIGFRRIILYVNVSKPVNTINLRVGELN